MDASPNHAHPQVTAEHRYATVIREARARPFEWGLHDCVTFAGAAVRARTQRQVLAELALFPTWRTALEAAAAIESVGGLRAALTRLFGEPVAVLQASAGDLAIAQHPDHPDREAVAVVHHGVLLTPAGVGLAVLPLDVAKGLQAWRIQSPAG